MVIADVDEWSGEGCLNQDFQDLRTRRIEKGVSESGFSGFKDKEDFKRSGLKKED